LRRACLCALSDSCHAVEVELWRCYRLELGRARARSRIIVPRAPAHTKPFPSLQKKSTGRFCGYLALHISGSTAPVTMDAILKRCRNCGKCSEHMDKCPICKTQFNLRWFVSDIERIRFRWFQNCQISSVAMPYYYILRITQ
jgi:hypothetical protein